jgi:hypothetical protein
VGDDNKCNFILFLYILRDFDKKYKSYTIQDVKQRLIKLYKNEPNILLKWMQEGKKDLAKKIKRDTTYDEVILSPTYFITVTDIFLLMNYFKLPIVLFIQKKGSVKAISVENSKKYHYFLKVKSNNQFFLHYIDDKISKTLRFTNISPQLSRQIQEMSIRDYMG